MSSGPPPIPDPDADPEAYTREAVLRDLYVRRGWRRRDIAAHFDVEPWQVKAALDEHNITLEDGDSPAPGSGLANRLWEIGVEKAQQTAGVNTGGVEHAD